MTDTPMTSQDYLLMALLDRIASGDQAALKALYEATSRKLYAVAMRVVSNTDHAEDVLQEAYLQVWRNAKDYRATLSPPMAWLGLIVRSRGLDLLRRHKAEKSLSAQPLDEILEETLSNNEASPMDVRDASEQAWALHECLRKIESKQREVLTLAYFKDLSQSELASQLKLPLGTVKSWMRRSIEQLRTCMNRFA
jgi:RNA polymerase sigma factor (sigma-70 family)